MPDAALAVVGDPALVGARTHRHIQESRHVVDGIGESAGLLDWGSTAEVDESTRHRGGAAPGSGALEDQDVGSAAAGLHRGGGSGHAIAGDHDVGLVVPVGDR